MIVVITKGEFLNLKGINPEEIKHYPEEKTLPVPYVRITPRGETEGIVSLTVEKIRSLVSPENTSTKMSITSFPKHKPFPFSDKQKVGVGI